VCFVYREKGKIGKIKLDRQRVNLLKMKHNLLYVRNQSVLCCKHIAYR
jgi:hypothetical protein